MCFFSIVLGANLACVHLLFVPFDYTTITNNPSLKNIALRKGAVLSFTSSGISKGQRTNNSYNDNEGFGNSVIMVQQTTVVTNM